MPQRLASIALLLVVTSCSATSHEVLDGGPADLAVDAPPDLAIAVDAGADAGRMCEVRAWTILQEVHLISQCTAASDCGQDLHDGCGCTRNRVVRNDADPSHLIELVHELAVACPSTPPPVFGGGPCDCPAADGIVCANGTCAWNFRDADCIYEGLPHRIGDRFIDPEGDGNWCWCSGPTDMVPPGSVICTI